MDPKLKRPAALSNDSVVETLSVSPIGFIHTGKATKFQAPHQPDLSVQESATIELLPHRDFHKALQDLEGFDYVWLIWWFHRNKNWKPKVQPPRGAKGKRGVFATRSPHRPNPIGISVVPLLGVEGLTVTVGSNDLLDGTPILDIKPYIPAVDSFPEARTGWLQQVEESYATPPAFEVALSDIAQTQASWLREHGTAFMDRAAAILARDPSEHRTRRIKRHGADLFRLACAGWRVFFSVHDSTVRIEHFAPGYPLSLLKAYGHEVIPDRAAMTDYYSAWPEFCPAGEERAL